MGGQDTPAAGFALYLDRLMKLVKQDITEEPMAKRILVSVAPGAEMTALAIAGKLREAGYIAGLALGEERANGYGWLLKVRDKSPRFVLINQSNDGESAVENDSEVIDLLGRE